MTFGRLSCHGLWILGWLALYTAFPRLSFSQDGDTTRPGHVMGKVSTQGQLIVMELNDGALGKNNLFDLAGHTLRFIPQRSGYRVENAPLQWDAEFGPELSGADVTLHQF